MRDDRWPFMVGQMLRMILYDDKKEELQSILGIEGAAQFRVLLQQIATSFYDQGEDARGLVRRSSNENKNMARGNE